MPPARRWLLAIVAAMAAATTLTAALPPPPAPPTNPSVMLPDEGDGGAAYLSLLLSSQAQALASVAPRGDPLAAALGDVAKVLLTLHDSVVVHKDQPFHAPPLAALFAGQNVNTTAADKALSIADRVLDELAAADWTQPVLSKRVIHALGVEELFADKNGSFAPTPPPPPPAEPWPSKGQAVVDELNALPAAVEKNEAANNHIEATSEPYSAKLADNARRGAEMQAQRATLDGVSGAGSVIKLLDDTKLPQLEPLPNKTLKGDPLPPPRKQVVDLTKPGANATLVASQRHVNLTAARFPIAPNISDFLGPIIDVLTADPVGSALAPALATSSMGRDPKLGNPISSYTTTSTFGVGQAERK